MTQNLNLKRYWLVSLLEAPDLPTTLHLVIHMCSSSLTILQLPESPKFDLLRPLSS